MSPSLYFLFPLSAVWLKKKKTSYHSVTSETRSAWPDAIGGNWNSHLTVLLRRCCVVFWVASPLCAHTCTYSHLKDTRRHVHISDMWARLKQYHSKTHCTHKGYGHTCIHIHTAPSHLTAIVFVYDQLRIKPWGVSLAALHVSFLCV